jgi:hypothetical protein
MYLNNMEHLQAAEPCFFRIPMSMISVILILAGKCNTLSIYLEDHDWISNPISDLEMISYTAVHTLLDLDFSS